MATKSQPHPGISTIINVAGFLLCVVSLAWVPKITNPLHNGVGGSYQFLTIISLTMTTMTFGIGLLGNISGVKQAFALKSALSICTTPLEVLVGTLYWGLYAIDKTLVVPPGHALPLIPNLGFHAMPAIMLTLDMLAGPLWSIKASGTIMLDLAFFFFYGAWLEYCYSFNGWYPYPNLVKNSPVEKLLLCLGAASLMAGNTLALKWVHGRFKTARGWKMD